MSQFAPGEAQLNYRSFSMAQDNRGLLYFATKSGLLHFDGREWGLFTGHGAFYTLTNGPKGELYFGGSNGFGRYDPETGNAFFWSPDSTHNVYSCIALADRELFLNDGGLYTYDVSGKQMGFLATPDPLTALFEIFGEAYATSSTGKLLHIEGNKLSPSNIPLPDDIIFASHQGNNYLIGTGDSRVFILDSKFKTREIKLGDADYAEASKIVNGVLINDSMAAVGTLRGGVIFFNPLTGITEEIINYATGLPDNEVFALMCDKNRNLWIAHDYGFSRVAPYLPFRSFTHYKGLDGNVQCALTFNGSIYVGTSTGLYQLARQDEYQEVVYYVTVTKTVGKQKEEEAEQPEKDQKKERRGFLGFLKRNRDNKTPEGKTGPQTMTVREKRTRKILLSSSYVYKAVNGIDAKISQLQVWNGKLIASGLSGMFTVDGLDAKPILEQPVKILLASKTNNALFFSTYSDEIGVIRGQGKDQITRLLNTGIREPIHDFFEGNDGAIWLCGLEQVYRMTLDAQDSMNVQPVTIPNPGVDETIGTVIDGKVVFVNTSGIYALDASRKPVAVDTLSSMPQQFFASNGNIWYADRRSWRNLIQNISSDKLQFLALLPEVRDLTVDKSNVDLWVISRNNELYKFDGNTVVPYEASNNVFLKEIDLRDKSYVDFRMVHLDETNSKVTVKAIQPDYLNAGFIAYRYKLIGLSDRWSEWSFDNTFDFPFIPSGKYTLMVEARNVFGKVAEMNPAAFEVLPPYWKRSWFYAMEATVFLMLVIVSFRLSIRYRIISRLLSLLTIILMIEFIQTVAGNMLSTHSSPVFDFLIQVIVALLILPVEGFLRKMMINSLEEKKGLYRILVPEHRRKQS